MDKDMDGKKVELNKYYGFKNGIQQIGIVVEKEGNGYYKIEVEDDLISVHCSRMWKED